MSLSGFAVVKVDAFNKEGKQADKNGLQNIILSPIGGRIPSKRVLAGTIADRAGFKIGEVHLVSFQEEEADSYGRRFTFTSLGVVAPGLELLKACKECGSPGLVDVSNNAQPTEPEITLQNAQPIAEPVM